jgi:L-ascorbate metabolism protein UlaG (beta-lactamase superfamily)
MRRTDDPPARQRPTEIERMPASANATADGTRVTFLGHASTVIEMDGMRLVTDPVLRRLVGPLYRRVPQPLTEPLVDPDVILISHLHLDHYDPRSLRLFRRDTPVLAPVGAGLSLRWRGFRDIHEVGPGERLRLGPLEVIATEARHRGTRHPLAARTPSLGYIVSGSRSIYFAGDTGFFSEIADVWPERLDLAMLPIAGIGPLMPEFKHMSPRHAVMAMELLRPRLVVPIHWGTYHLPGTAIMRMRPDFHRRAPYLFMAQAGALEPDVHTVMLRPGEILSLEEALAGHAGHAALGPHAVDGGPTGPPELAGPGVPGGVL